MSRVYVCPLAHVGAVARSSGAGSMVSLLSPGSELPAMPASVTRHLGLILSDIAEARVGHVLAGSSDLDRLLAFVETWDRSAPLLIHCYAGVSRSTAAAFIVLCALDPGRPETEHALSLRRASPTATPNARLVALADDVLRRRGRMIQAIIAIGRGAECYEGNVFSLPVPEAAARAQAIEMG